MGAAFTEGTLVSDGIAGSGAGGMGADGTDGLAGACFGAWAKQVTLRAVKIARAASLFISGFVDDIVSFINREGVLKI